MKKGFFRVAIAAMVSLLVGAFILVKTRDIYECIFCHSKREIVWWNIGLPYGPYFQITPKTAIVKISKLCTVFFVSGCEHEFAGTHTYAWIMYGFRWVFHAHGPNVASNFSFGYDYDQTFREFIQQKIASQPDVKNRLIRLLESGGSYPDGYALSQRLLEEYRDEERTRYQAYNNE